jgi:hypothetical protein
MHRSIVKTDIALMVYSGECVFHPVLIIPMRKVLARVGAAAFSAGNR